MVSIKERLVNNIQALGFMPFDIFMNILLADPIEGYYCNKNPFDTKGGDFTTSPELSQVFGELIGLWLAETWITMNKPTKFNLVELGGGSGLLINDILRTTKHIEGFHKALSLHFVEINPIFQDLQQSVINHYESIIANWYLSVKELNVNGSTIIFSNEFFDAMPLKQYCYKNNECYELGVVINKAKELQLSFIPLNGFPKRMLPIHKEDSAIYESSPIGNYVFKQLIDIITANKGAILTIDYGYVKPVNRSSIRGFQEHQLLDIQKILQTLSNADITYNVNFHELQAIAQEHSITSYDILTQQEFLNSLGFAERVKILANGLNTEERESFISKNNKIVKGTEMGESFKVMAVSSGLNHLPGFTSMK